MKDILIVAHFIATPEEKGNDRFSYISKELALRYNDKYNVELLTSSFSHSRKRQRVFDKERQEVPYQISLIYEPGYKKNVSLERFYSHYIFAQNVKKYLKTRKHPDLVFCSVPSLDVADVCRKYALKNKIPFVIDIQDLWPEAFEMVFNIPIISTAI